MKIVGFILIAVGLVDLVGSYTEFDLWGGFLGIQLPDLLWKYSSYIELIAGYGLINLAPKSNEVAETANEETAEKTE